MLKRGFISEKGLKEASTRIETAVIDIKAKYFDNDYQLMPESMLQCIPNLMGINLCSVKGIERICIGNQIVSLRIDFKPNVKAFD